MALSNPQLSKLYRCFHPGNSPNISPTLHNRRPLRKKFRAPLFETYLSLHRDCSRTYTYSKFTRGQLLQGAPQYDIKVGFLYLLSVQIIFWQRSTVMQLAVSYNLGLTPLGIEFNATRYTRKREWPPVLLPNFKFHLLKAPKLMLRFSNWPFSSGRTNYVPPTRNFQWISDARPFKLHCGFTVPTY